jgi:hypothetical protein
LNILVLPSHRLNYISKRGKYYIFGFEPMIPLKT